MSNNIYGVQRVPETEVRSGGSVAGSAASAAAQGAVIGAKFGPWGAAIGAVGGAAMGYFGAKKGQAQEKVMSGTEKEHNEFADSLEGRSLRSNEMVRAQARKGMKSSRYMVAEIEGDGNKYQQGIGEIHTDKNFNIKTVAAGAPTHEEGGVDVMMKEGDVVFPTQGSKDKFNKVLNAINRYKLKGDSKAKKFLEKERSKLPTDEDYGYARKGLRYEKGVKDKNPGPYADEFWDEINENKEYFKNDLETPSTGGGVITGQGTQEQAKKDPTIEQEVLALRQSLPDSPTKEDWNKALDSKGKDFKVKTWEYMKQKGLDVGTSYTDNFWGPKSTKAANSLWGKVPEESSSKEEITEITNPPLESTITKYKQPVDRNIRKDEDTPGYNVDDATRIAEHNNPLKYASTINNLVQGTKPAERVERRYYTPEEFDYNDRSYGQRRAITEQRNASREMLRGKGLSAGQQQSYESQAGARYLGAMENVNESEARRADQIDMQNTQNINQAKHTNIGLANQYDTWDAQARAVKQRYSDTAYSEMSRHAMVDEQGKYMRSRNQKQYEMDRVRLGLLKDINPDFYVGEDNLSQIRYKR